MDSKKLIREFVQSVTEKLKSEQKQKLREEKKLRRYIRNILKEVEEASPHDSTGINVLEDLLKTIVPILASGYKQLTSDLEQRKSFRAHIIRAVQNLLSTEAIYFQVGKKNTEQPEQLSEQEEQEITGPEEEEVDPAFIDIEKDKKKKEAEDAAPKPEDAFMPIAGQDPTGRGFAAKSFDKIQKQIIDSYSLLGKEEDREVFYDYLLTNLKLYFDKFEDELQKILQEPTTPAYEAEKQKKLASLEPASTAEPELEAGTEMAEPGEEETEVPEEEEAGL